MIDTYGRIAEVHFKLGIVDDGVNKYYFRVYGHSTISL